MAENQKYYYMRLRADFFNRKDIILLESHTGDTEMYRSPPRNMRLLKTNIRYMQISMLKNYPNIWKPRVSITIIIMQQSEVG